MVFLLGGGGRRRGRVRKEGPGEGSRETITKPPMDSNGNPIALHISLCINSSKVSHLTNPERAGSSSSCPPTIYILNDSAYLPKLLLTPESEIPLAFQKAFHVTFSMLSNSALHPRYHSVISDCHGQFSASGKQKRGMEGEGEWWPR